jgi:hypothetical protein
VCKPEHLKEINYFADLDIDRRIFKYMFEIYPVRVRIGLIG